MRMRHRYKEPHKIDKKTKSSVSVYVDSYLDNQTLPLSIEKPAAALHGSQLANRKLAL